MSNHRTGNALDYATALDYVGTVFAVLPGLIQAGKDINSLIAGAKKIADSGGNPTSEQWDELNAIVKEQHNRFQEP